MVGVIFISTEGAIVFGGAAEGLLFFLTPYL